MSISPVSSNQSSTTSNSGPNEFSAGNLDTTFLNLLTTELKSQDPTSPMDSNQMVSQMVALNQLDQLIAIRQTLQQTTTNTSTSTPSTNGVN